MSTRIEPSPITFLIAGTLLGFATSSAIQPRGQKDQNILQQSEIKFDQDGDGKLSDTEFIAAQQHLAKQQHALIDLYNKSKESK